MASPKPHAIVFPYPYQGHVNPMINLSIRLASMGFTITFVQTEFIHHSISKAHHLPPSEFNLFSHAQNSGLDIRYMKISDGFPLEFDRDLNFDHYWETMFRDFPTRVDEIVARTMKGEHPSSFFLIADTFYTWPATIAKKNNIVHVSLWTEPAIVFSINYHLNLLRQNGHLPPSGDDGNQINYIPGVESIRRRDLMSYIQDPDMIPMLTEIAVKAFEQVKEADFILCNTVQELESEALSALNQNRSTNYAIGPINFYMDFTKTGISRSLWSESDCTQWLSSKPPGSVLYISFGSIAQINKKDIAEFAYGLLKSAVYFVWVLRPDSVEGNKIDVLPRGFRDTIKDRGLIVPWCNQNTVLSSPSTGGFLTHCGWNSILESIWFGVPMICYPFLVDQPTNRKLVVDDWRVGVDLCEEQEVTRKEVSDKINVVMRGATSAKLNQEIKKVSQILHSSLGTEGSSQKNFNQFLEDLKTKLYMRSKNG